MRDALAKAKKTTRNASHRDAEKMRRWPTTRRRAQGRGRGEQASGTPSEANRRLKDAEAEMAKLRVDAESERERWRAAMEERYAARRRSRNKSRISPTRAKSARGPRLNDARRWRRRARGLAEVNAIARLSRSRGEPGVRGRRARGRGRRGVENAGRGVENAGRGRRPRAPGGNLRPGGSRPRWTRRSSGRAEVIRDARRRAKSGRESGCDESGESDASGRNGAN